MTPTPRWMLAGALASALFVNTGSLLAAPKQPGPPPLSPEAQKAHDSYSGMLEGLRSELCAYTTVDPVKRYAFYEKSYLEKERMPQFDKHSIWLLRHVVNDPHPEEDMLWMREMIWDYRPDQINAPEEYNAHVVGLMYSEFEYPPVSLLRPAPLQILCHG